MPTGFALKLLFDKAGEERPCILVRDLSCIAVAVAGPTAGVRAAVVVGDERMYRVAVGPDCGSPHRAVIVRPVVRFRHDLCTAFHGFVERVVRIFDIKSDVAHAVAVLLDVLGRRVIR